MFAVVPLFADVYIEDDNVLLGSRSVRTTERC